MSPCETTDQISNRKEDVGEDQSPAAGVDICESAAEGLAGGIGDEVGGCEPGEQREGIEGRGDGCREGGDDSRVCDNALVTYRGTEAG